MGLLLTHNSTPGLPLGRVEAGVAAAFAVPNRPIVAPPQSAAGPASPGRRTVSMTIPLIGVMKDPKTDHAGPGGRARFVHEVRPTTTVFAGRADGSPEAPRPPGPSARPASGASRLLRTVTRGLLNGCRRAEKRETTFTFKGPTGPRRVRVTEKRLPVTEGINSPTHKYWL